MMKLTILVDIFNLYVQLNELYGQNKKWRCLKRNVQVADEIKRNI